MDDERTAQVRRSPRWPSRPGGCCTTHVVRQPAAVSRDEAAGGRRVAARHRRLPPGPAGGRGLLDVVFERRTGRSGPGAGRRRSSTGGRECDVAVSLPERHYDLAGGLLAGRRSTRREATGEPPAGRARPAGLRARARAGRGRAGEASPRAAGRSRCGCSRQHGFEPRAEDGGIALANCPFHRLAREHTELVCGMNLRLLDGVLDGVGGPGARRRGCSRRRACAACDWSRPTAQREPVDTGRRGSLLLSTLVLEGDRHDPPHRLRPRRRRPQAVTALGSGAAEEPAALRVVRGRTAVDLPAAEQAVPTCSARWAGTRPSRTWPRRRAGWPTPSPSC